MDLDMGLFMYCSMMLQPNKAKSFEGVPWNMTMVKMCTYQDDSFQACTEQVAKACDCSGFKLNITGHNDEAMPCLYTNYNMARQ